MLLNDLACFIIDGQCTAWEKLPSPFKLGLGEQFLNGSSSDGYSDPSKALCELLFFSSRCLQTLKLGEHLCRWQLHILRESLSYYIDQLRGFHLMTDAIVINNVVKPPSRYLRESAPYFIAVVREWSVLPRTA